MDQKSQYKLACRYWRALEASERYWWDNALWDHDGESGPVTDYYDYLEEFHQDARQAYIDQGIPGDLMIMARVTIQPERARWFYLSEQVKRQQEFAEEYQDYIEDFELCDE